MRLKVRTRAASQREAQAALLQEIKRLGLPLHLLDQIDAYAERTKEGDK